MAQKCFALRKQNINFNLVCSHFSLTILHNLILCEKVYTKSKVKLITGFGLVYFAKLFKT